MKRCTNAQPHSQLTTNTRARAHTHKHKHTQYLQALGDYYHSKGLKYALYTAESPTTCGGYPASANHELLDAKTFADWGVDYMKVDGCGPADYYSHGYKAMGDNTPTPIRFVYWSLDDTDGVHRPPFPPLPRRGCRKYHHPCSSATLC